jgi:hypothetical protein
MSLENCNIASSLSKRVLHLTRAGQSDFWSVWPSTEEQGFDRDTISKSASVHTQEQVSGEK